MPVKVFVLGPPGSGKSTTCRTIHGYFLQHNEIRHVARLNDYDILWEMFLDDLRLNPLHRRRFEPTTEYKGFNIKKHAYAVFDEALRLANLKMHIWLEGEQEQWIMMEFARDNYIHAFAQFDPSLLKDAYFLFIEAQEELCRERLRERIRHPITSDDHYVSDYILDNYYKMANKLNVLDFCGAYDIEVHRVEFIANNGSLEDFLVKIRQFAEAIVR